MNSILENQTDSGLRKAAVLAASLDRDLADTLLEQLTEEQARHVRRLMVEMDDIDPSEQRRVIDEFSRAGATAPPSQPADGKSTGAELAGVELAGRLAAESREQPASLPEHSQPFLFLQDAEGAKLARVLEKERPQTIALVLSHLPSDRASRVLAGFPDDLQAEVVRRLVDLEETDPAILREVEQALQLRLSRQVHMQRRRVAGIEAVEGILAACDGPTSTRILDNPATYDEALAERIGPPVPHFDDLIRLDDGDLSVVFKATQPELALTALIGASETLIARILRRFPEPEAQTIRHKLDYPGPIRLSDVEEARRQIAELARRLAMEGKIRLSGPGEYSVQC